MLLQIRFRLIANDVQEIAHGEVDVDEVQAEVLGDLAIDDDVATNLVSTVTAGGRVEGEVRLRRSRILGRKVRLSC